MPETTKWAETFESGFLNHAMILSCFCPSLPQWWRTMRSSSLPERPLVKHAACLYSSMTIVAILSSFLADLLVGLQNKTALKRNFGGRFSLEFQRFQRLMVKPRRSSYSFCPVPFPPKAE